MIEAPLAKAGRVARLTNTWGCSIASPQRSGPEGTFHRFSGKPEKRIDWILFRGLRPVRAKTVTTNREQRYASDHFPVIAEFELLRKVP